MRSTLACSVIALGLFATSAAADGRPFSWTGFYVGGHVGVANASWDGKLETTAGNPPDNYAGYANPLQSVGAARWMGGGQIGANLQMGVAVIGIEADLSWTGIETDDTFATDAYNPWVWSKRHQFTVDGFGTLRGRLGYAMGGTLPYLTGGLAWAKTSGTIAVSQSHSNDIEGNPIIDGTSHAWSKDNRMGWTVGGGVEQALGANWSVKVEYLYADLGKTKNAFKGGTVFDKGVTPFDTDAFPADLTLHIVRGGLNYRF